MSEGVSEKNRCDKILLSMRFFDHLRLFESSI